MAVFARFVSTESEDELRQNEQLEQHATLVMSTMDEAITHMDNYDYITDFLHKTGGTHQRFDSFKVDYFVKIREPFLEAVKITLGDRYTDYMKNVYEITINFILKGLENGYLDNNHPTEHTIIVTYHPTEQPEVTKLDNCNVQNDDGTNTEQAKT